MKVSELNVQIGDDDCDVCEVHKKANQVLPPGALFCPHCGERADDDQDMVFPTCESQVVGESNYVSPDEERHRRAVFQCEHCHKNAVVSLAPIIYNGSHDVYYTGGKKYLPVCQDGEAIHAQVKAAALPLIEQYTRRIRAGEQLEPGIWPRGWNTRSRPWWLRTCRRSSRKRTPNNHQINPRRHGASHEAPSLSCNNKNNKKIGDKLCKLKCNRTKSW